MKNKDLILNKFRSELLPLIEKHFETAEKFGRYYIYNLEILKGSSFEKTPIISHFIIHHLDDLPLGEIIIGDITNVELNSQAEIIADNNIPKRGKELINIRQLTLMIKLHVEVSYDRQIDEIEILSVSVSPM